MPTALPSIDVDASDPDVVLIRPGMLDLFWPGAHVSVREFSNRVPVGRDIDLVIEGTVTTVRLDDATCYFLDVSLRLVLTGLFELILDPSDDDKPFDEPTGAAAPLPNPPPFAPLGWGCRRAQAIPPGLQEERRALVGVSMAPPNAPIYHSHLWS